MRKDISLGGVSGLLIASISTIFFSFPVQAETRTLWVKGYPITRGGELVGCSLEYNAAIEDHIYRQGKLTGLVGNISLNQSDNPSGTPYFVGLKVALTDYEGDTANPTRPAQIHLVSSDGTVWKGEQQQSFLSDMPGGLLQMLLPEDAMVRVFDGILTAKTVTVAFNRRIDGVDAKVPLDLMVADTDVNTGKVVRNDNAVSEWAKCTSQLLNLNK